MPTSMAANASSVPLCERGFTLVELLVVILVLALAASAVAVTAAPRDPVGATAARFAGRVAAARDLAVTANRPVSVWVGPAGYGFDQWQRGGWRPVDERALSNADWPAASRVAASGIAGRAAALAGGVARVTFDNLGMPDSPASVAIARDGRSASVAIRADGSVEVE